MIPAGKIKSLDETVDVLAPLRKAGRKIVHCHGVFDLLHIGHLRHLKAARKFGDLLVVTRQPLVLDARAYGLGDGIEALRTLAGLAQLAPTVPVTFTLLLRKQPAAALNAQ